MTIFFKNSGSSHFDQFVAYIEAIFEDFAGYKDTFILTAEDFAVVPVEKCQWEYLGLPFVGKLFESFEFIEPRAGQVYWRVPGYFTKEKCIDLVTEFKSEIERMKNMQEGDLMLMDTKQDLEFQEREMRREQEIEARKRQIRDEKNAKRDRQPKPKKEGRDKKKSGSRFVYVGEDGTSDEELELGDYQSSAYDRSKKSTVNKMDAGDLNGNQMDEEDIKPVDETRRARENKLKMLARMADDRDNLKEVPTADNNVSLEFFDSK
jgi:hypothetical protein